MRPEVALILTLQRGLPLLKAASFASFWSVFAIGISFRVTPSACTRRINQHEFSLRVRVLCALQNCTYGYELEVKPPARARTALSFSAFLHSIRTRRIIRL